MPIGPVCVLMPGSAVFFRGSQRGCEQQPDQRHKKGRQQAEGRQAEFEALSCHGLLGSKIGAAAGKTDNSVNTQLSASRACAGVYWRQSAARICFISGIGELPASGGSRQTGAAPAELTTRAEF